MSGEQSDVTGLDQLDPAVDPARDARALPSHPGCTSADRGREQELRDAVKAARVAGYSWTVIASALDATRQAAHERFGGN